MGGKPNIYVKPIYVPYGAPERVFSIYLPGDPMSGTNWKMRFAFLNLDINPTL